MISLAASQADLAGRDGIALVRLFHLTTYSDRDLGTVQAEHWFTMGTPARYRWAGGSARDFADLVMGCDAIALSVDHLPDPNVPSQRRSRVTVQLANDSLDGAILWATLSAQNLAFARLEIATLAVERSRFETGSAFWDLSDLPGTEHVLRFRGELTGIDAVGDENGVRLTFESEEPAVLWPELKNATDADPKDLGRRYAIPFGRAKGVPCVNRRVGWATTLSDVLASTTTGNVKVTSTAGLPTSGSITLSIDAERVTATRVDATTINISARGVSGTPATAHQRGAPVLEILSSVTIVVAGVPCKALDALYVMNPATREPVLVPSTLYTASLKDLSTDAGRALTTVTFTQANLEALIDSLAASGSEPSYEEVTFNKFVIEAPGGTDWTDCVLNPDGLGIRLNGRSAVATAETALFTIDPAAIPTSQVARGIVRIRVRAIVNGEGDTLNGPTNQDAQTNLHGEVRFLGWDNSGGPADHLENLDYTFAAGSQESGVAIATAWYTPQFAKLGGDLDEIRVRFDFNPPHATPNQYLSDNWAFVFAGSVVAEIEYSPSRTGSLGAAAFGLGLVFTADVQGVAVPDSFRTGYGFEDGTGWSLGGGMAQTNLTTMQRFGCTLALIADSAGTADDSTLWTAVDSTLANDATIKTQGANSVRITPTASGNVARARRTLSATADWTAFYLVVDVYPTGANHLNAGDGVRVRVDDTGGDFKRWSFGTDDGLALSTWRTIILDLASTPDNSSGTTNLDAIATLEITGNGRQNSTSNVLYFDNVRLLSKAAVAQLNATAGAVDLTTGVTSLYRTRVKATNVGRITGLTLRFGNTAGSGTTLPATYRSIFIQPWELAEGSWVDVDRTGSDTGSPGLGAIEFVRVEIGHDGLSLSLPEVELDFVAGANATNADWSGMTPGTLLEEGPDAIRYFVGEFARMGAANVLDVPATKTNLGALAFAGTFDSLGDSFASVLARLAFETRCNVLVKPSSSGLVFQLSAADTAFAFPAAALTLSEFRSLRESSRPALATPSSFRAHYAPVLPDGDALGLDERAFRGLLIADSSESALSTAPATLALVAAKVGQRPADPLFLLFSQDPVTAIAIASFYVAESIRTPARRWSLAVPISDGYALEPFDVVALRPRWLGADVKARIVETRFPLDAPIVELELVEVP